ncbi:MAG: LCP family protein [Firmicutes bacterium]|nr:LCP family protein [Bacillota bacterium]
MPPYYYRTRKKRYRLKKGRLLHLLAICLFLLLLFFTARFLGTLHELQDRSAWTKDLPRVKEGRQHLLLYSVANRDSEPLISNIYVLSLQPNKQKIHAIEIPANTILETKKQEIIPLAASLTTQGRKFVIESVSDLLGVDLHAFVEIKENQLAEVAGELDIVFPDNMGIKNRDDIIPYIYAQDLSSTQRAERLRQVLAVLAGNILDGNIIQQVMKLRKAVPLITTNLSWRQLLKTSKEFAAYDFAETAQIYSLPGSIEKRTDGNYWRPDADSLPALAAWLESEESSPPREQITVEVLNGCGITGLANQVAQFLREEGFSVTRVTNAENFNYEFTQVISRTNDPGPAKDIALLLPNAQLLMEEKPDAAVMVTVIIGKNYNNSE